MADLDNIPEPQPRKRFWGKIAMAIACVCFSVGITVAAFGFNATNHFQQEQIRDLQKVTACQTQVAVDVDLARGNFALAQGTLLSDIVDVLVSKVPDNDRLQADVTAVNAAKILYTEALEARAATNDRCDSP